MGTLCPHCNKGIVVTLGKPQETSAQAEGPKGDAPTMREVIASTLPPTPKRPHGLAEIKATFGAPGQVPMELVEQTLTTGLRVRFYAHKLLAPRFRWIFNEIVMRGLSSCIKSFDGCYNDRPKNNIPGNDKSVHAWAIAVDINCDANMPGMSDHIDPRVSAVFEEAGFIHLKGDFMHFQYCTGY